VLSCAEHWAVLVVLPMFSSAKSLLVSLPGTWKTVVVPCSLYILGTRHTFRDPTYI
jgi:hypothetical protein